MRFDIRRLAMEFVWKRMRREDEPCEFWEYSTYKLCCRSDSSSTFPKNKRKKHTHICIVFMYKKKEKIHRNEEKGRGEEICVENIIGAMYASL